MIKLTNILSYEVPEGKFCSSLGNMPCGALRTTGDERYYYECLLFQKSLESAIQGIEKCDECKQACNYAKQLYFFNYGHDNYIMTKEELYKVLKSNTLNLQSLPPELQQYLMHYNEFFPGKILKFLPLLMTWSRVDIIEKLQSLTVYRLGEDDDQII